MDSLLALEISGSVAVTVSILALLWIFRHRHYYTVSSKVISVTLALYTILHLCIHTSQTSSSLSIGHILLDDGVIVLIAIFNAVNSHRRRH